MSDNASGLFADYLQRRRERVAKRNEQSGNHAGASFICSSTARPNRL
jgi:hypothetical protein